MRERDTHRKDCKRAVLSFRGLISPSQKLFGTTSKKQEENSIHNDFVILYVFSVQNHCYIFISSFGKRAEISNKS